MILYAAVGVGAGVVLLIAGVCLYRRRRSRAARYLTKNQDASERNDHRFSAPLFASRGSGRQEPSKGEGSAGWRASKFEFGSFGNMGAKDFYAKETRKSSLPVQGMPGLPQGRVSVRPEHRKSSVPMAGFGSDSRQSKASGRKQSATPGMYLAAARQQQQKQQQQQRIAHAANLNSYFAARARLSFSGRESSEPRESVQPRGHSGAPKPVLLSGTSMACMQPAQVSCTTPRGPGGAPALFSGTSRMCCQPRG